MAGGPFPDHASGGGGTPAVADDVASTFGDFQLVYDETTDDALEISVIPAEARPAGGTVQGQGITLTPGAGSAADGAGAVGGVGGAQEIIGGVGGVASVADAAGEGGEALLGGGVGGAASGAGGPGGDGGPGLVAGGDGGAGNTNDNPGSGGPAMVSGGEGGAGTATLPGGTGGAVAIDGGPGGGDGGAGPGVAGDVAIGASSPNLALGGGGVTALRGGLTEQTFPTETATDADATITAGQLMGGIYNRLGTFTASRTDTLDTAANLLALMINAQVGDTLKLHVRNQNTAAQNLVIAMGAGGTYKGQTGDLTLAQYDRTSFLIRWTNVTPAAEAYDVFAI